MNFPWFTELVMPPAAQSGPSRTKEPKIEKQCYCYLLCKRNTRPTVKKGVIKSFPEKDFSLNSIKCAISGSLKVFLYLFCKRNY